MTKLIAVLIWALLSVSVDTFAQPVPDLILPAPRPVILNWNNNATDEAGTEIERAEDAGGFVKVFSLVGADLVSWTDNNIVQHPTADKRYCWRVRDFTQSGSNVAYSQFTNAACAVVKAPLQPPNKQPTNLTISVNNATGTITIVGTGFTVTSVAPER